MATEFTQPQLNRKKVDPSLKDLLDLHKKDIMLSLNCHAIGTIQSFNSTNQTATATINYKKTVLKQDTNGVVYNELINYPVLLDIPVVIIGGGLCNLTFPIATGDECLILFNDRDIDNWFSSGQVGPVASSRLHSFADGIAIVGVKSLLHSITGYDMTRAKLAYGETYVGVSATQVKIANNITTLNTLLQSLITTIQAITTTNAVVGVPCTLSPASIAALTSVASQIGGLLE